MRRTSIVIALAFLTCTVLHVFGDSPAERRKAETLAKADKLLGQRYSPPAGKPLRLYDQQTEFGPPDGVIFWHGADYAVQLVFADDGSVARLRLLPEALLHSDSWSDVPEHAELSQAEMKWLLDSAETLQPLGKPDNIKVPNFCSVSGPNLYCTDHYEQAFVSHYHRKRVEDEHKTNSVLREISIFYRQSVSGIVEDVRVEGSQRQLKVGGYWYYGQTPGSDIFRDLAKGSLVRFITFGCATNQKVCHAVREESTSGVTSSTIPQLNH